MPTLLGICEEALQDVGSFVVPSYLFSNPDDTAKQLISIARKVGRELMRDHDFQELTGTATITTVASTDNYALPADYDRLVSETAWDSSTKRRLIGDTSSARWAAITNATVQTGVSHFFKLKGGRIYVSPTPTSVWTFNFEYRSNAYCQSAAGVAQSEWQADDDTPRLPYDLFIAGVLYYFQKGNNLPYADAEAEYNAILGRREETNKPAGIIDLAANIRCPRAGLSLNIPDRVDA